RRAVARSRGRHRRSLLGAHRRLAERTGRQPAHDSGGKSMTILLDPTSERSVASRTLTTRPQSLEGNVVGLLEISKPRGNVLLDRIAGRVAGEGATVLRFAKPTYTKPAPVDLRHEIAGKCDVLIEALAD